MSGVEIGKLKKIGKKIFSIPSNFNAHKTLKRVFELKNQMFLENKVDWSSAEILAIATLLTEGFRLDFQAKTQDVELLAKGMRF